MMPAQIISGSLGHAVVIARRPYIREIEEPETYIVPGEGASRAAIPKANKEEHV